MQKVKPKGTGKDEVEASSNCLQNYEINCLLRQRERGARGGDGAKGGATCGCTSVSYEVATTSSRQVKVLPNGMENVSRDMRAGIINYFAH